MLNDDFFSYKPLVVGVVIDVGDWKRLSIVKGSLVEMIASLECETEDKVYVYHPDTIDLYRHLGESVAAVANYAQKAGTFNPEVALKHTLNAISVAPDGDRKYLLYFVDHTDSHTANRLHRVGLYGQSRMPDVKLVIFPMVEGLSFWPSAEHLKKYKWDLREVWSEDLTAAYIKEVLDNGHE